MQVAAELARGSQATLVLLYVWQPKQWMTDYGMQWPNEVLLEAQATEEGKLAMCRVDAQRLGAPEVMTRLLRGEPWDQIVSVAREEAVDLIVMGTHGRTGLRRALIGSVAERVVRHAPCTVMVVRAPQAR